VQRFYVRRELWETMDTKVHELGILIGFMASVQLITEA